MFNHFPPQELPEIKQINIDGKRHYETPVGTFISITTLLSSQIPQGVLEWRKSVGDDVANYVMQMASTRGNKVHEMVESYLSNKPQNDLLDEFGGLMGDRSSLFSLFENLRSSRLALNKATSETKGVSDRLEAVRFQHTEIQKASLLPGEADRLRELKKRLLNSDSIHRLSVEARHSLYEAEGSVIYVVTKSIIWKLEF